MYGLECNLLDHPFHNRGLLVNVYHHVVLSNKRVIAIRIGSLTIYYYMLSYCLRYKHFHPS